MNVVNTLVYNDRLQCGSEEVASGRLCLPLLPSPHTPGLRGRCTEAEGWMVRVLAPQLPVLFLDTDGCRDGAESEVGGQICNNFEADLTARLVVKLMKV